MAIRYKRQWEVASFTDTRKVYKVSEDMEGHFVCSCPHHIFRKVECKHIRMIRDRIDTIDLAWVPVSHEEKARRIVVEDSETPKVSAPKATKPGRRLSLE